MKSHFLRPIVQSNGSRVSPENEPPTHWQAFHRQHVKASYQTRCTECVPAGWLHPEAASAQRAVVLKTAADWTVLKINLCLLHPRR
uniref:Uncharacterized protein n=1 Tax=Chelonoidis abingdonii TaxID=106734 RepID=A0A8C0HJ06_CHEAB